MFANDFVRFLVRAQTDKPRMPQLRSPLQKFDRRHKTRREPAALGHLFCRESLAPSTFGPLGKIPERALFNTQACETREQRSP